NVNPFELSTKFNYKSVLDPDANVIVLGKITDVAYGEYELNISQTNKPIASRNIKVYKTLTSDDISVSVPNADYDGEFLRYEKLTAKPTDFETNYASYYEYIGGRYVSVTNKTWSESKAYYTKQFVDAYTKLLEKPEDFETNYSAYYIYDVTSGTYIPVSVGTWADDVEYYKKSNIEFIDTLIDSNNTYILSTSSTYDVNVEIEGDAFVSVASKSATAEFVDSYQLLTVEPADFTTSYADYYKWEGAYIQLTSEETFVEGKYYKKLDVLKTNLNNMAQTSTSKDEIVTGVNGTFNTVTGVKNYVKITYTITPTKYDYYQISKTSGIPQTKSIYVYVYEPLQTATFNKTMLYKYAYSYQDANREYLLGSLREELGTEQLKIEINGSSETSALNYVDIMWMRLSDGVEIRPQNDITSATYQFNTIRGESVSGTIYAVITQFGTQFSIQCGYHVSNPILTERVMLNTPSQTFKTGGAYINMKLGDELEIDAEQHSSLGDVTVDELNYITCNVSGAQSDGIISYDAGSGKLVANNAGRAKLVIVSTDALKETLYSGLNYLNKSTYVRADALDCVLIIDIIVSDGSEENPYLIATADDFRKIKDDFVAKEEHGWRPEYDENNYLLNGVNNKHYALTENVDIKGKPIQFSGDFAGSVVSYQEREGVNNRFTVYGVMLTESNSTLFTNVTKEAKMENLTFHIDINYNRTTIPSSDILIGLIGKNAGQINNVISVVSGKINDNVSRAVSYSNFDYTIGALIAHNKGDVTIDDVTLVGVKGDIIVNTPNSSVVLGGLIGKNEGNIIGAHTGAKQNTSTGKVEYEVYYDNQGATADVVLQVKSAKSEGAI
ncbi:MAG: hypothetical protein IJA72_02390, partial [Clostridia bacterium]|nr:hypothetical protein [Clostridia bacterium]